MSPGAAIFMSSQGEHEAPFETPASVLRVQR
jgi:hypothetical protein